MKKIPYIVFVTVLCTLALFAACLSASAFSAITFEADDAVVPNAPGGYPRLERFDDGTLIFVNSGAVRTSRDGGKTWVRHTLTNGLDPTYTYRGVTHTLARENWQGYVLPDGRLMVLYRAHTQGDIASGDAFYTSIRARIFNGTPDDYMNGARSLTYESEQIVVEAATTGFHGFWEPYVVQIGPDTLACYYADDYSVSKPSTQQNIAYKLYTVSTGAWSSQSYVAINGASRSSRDGMPVVTKLSDGTFAMVFEAFDYNWRTYNGTYGKSVFVISMSRSTDGRNWSTPIPIAAPQNITAEKRCAAPFITTLSDGRIVVSYMTDDLYIGSITGEYDRARYCNSTLMVSKAVVTNTSSITATTGGVSSSFTSLGTPVTPIANGYQIWSSVSAFEGDLYFATSAGTNDGSVPASTQIRYAAVDPAMPILTVQNKNEDGSILVSVAKTSAGDGYKYYRSEDGGAFALIATTAATSYADTAVTPGHIYTYKATSYRGSAESEASATVSATALPAAPTVTAKYNGTTVTLSWNLVAGATRYRVCRKLLGATSWTALGAVTSDKKTYADSTASPETTYVYRVEADTVVDTAHNYSASDGKTVTAWTVRPTLTISGKTADSVTLTWTASSTADGYRVFRRKSSGESTYSVIADVTGGDTVTYTDTGLLSYTNYAYILRAVYTDGETEYVSFDAGAVFAKTLCSHDYSGVITTSPTCTATGVMTYTCTVCGDSYTADAPALGHSYDGGVITTSPTCTATGVRTYTCTRCGDSYTEDVSALGHSYDGGVITTAPTCTATGVRTYTCTVCGDSYTEDVAPLGHDFAVEYTVDVAPTCTAVGSKSQHCSRCDARRNITEVAALGHSYDGGVITTAPTCTETGVRTYTCTVCGDSYTADAPALGHDFAVEYTVDVAPTCTAVGSKSQHCSRCDARQNITEVPMVEHTYGDGVVTTAPQIGARGVLTYTCTVCGHTVENEIPALDEVTLVQTPVTAGDDFNEIAARAGEKGFAILSLAADAESGAVTGAITLTGDVSCIYRKSGHYLTPVGFTETGDGVRFVGNAGEQIVYSEEPLVLFGDINADGQRTLSDVLRGFRYLADNTVTLDYAATDLSGNCAVELLDLLLTLRQILGG